MSLTWARITLRLHRFELVAFALVLGGLTLTTFGVAAYVHSLLPGPECYVSDIVSPACVEAGRAFDEARQSMGILAAPVVVVCYAIGVFLGVPILARELERGTLRLAWSLALSRWRWYTARAIPVLAVLIVLTFVAGVAVDTFFSASTPNEDFSRSFAGYGARGGILAARAAFIFALSVTVGSIIGRALPAVIVAAIVAALAMGGGIWLQDRILRAEAVAVPKDANGTGGASVGDLSIDTQFVLPDGTLVGWEYFIGSDPFDANGNPKLPMVAIVVPGERYRFVEAREAMALGVATLVVLVLGGFVVLRRRPG